mmetsp:Transcript_16178/g.44788  ORF Transcript_16178/g.44788 Transcript_16178/m.44788 type:complete len:318 (+) Transcript_16178:40-993(+)
MFFPKSVTAFALLAVSASVGAFTTPKTSLHHDVVSPAIPQQAIQPANLNGFDHSLNLWNKEPAVEEPPITTSFGDNGRNDLIAPAIYAVFTGLLIAIVFDLRDAVGTKTIGSSALALVTLALVWDNLIISIGSLFFRDVETNEKKYKILETLSYPRFTGHAVAVPFQCVTIAEMGKFAGVEFLQSDIIQTVAIVAAFVVAIADRKTFTDGPGIILDTEFDTPVDALERDLVKFTYKEPKFAYVLPVIFLALFNLVVGINARGIEGSLELGNWMVFAAGSALIGNGVPGKVKAFAGNLGEVGMQYGLLRAAEIVYAGL